MTQMTDMPQFSFGDRRKKFKVSRDCDEVELAAIKNGKANSLAGVRNDLISGVLRDDALASFNGADWQAESNAVEDLSSEIVKEIENRVAILGELYPFVFDGSSLIYVKPEHRIYEFLLICSVTKNITTGYNTFLPRNFERIAMEICANFIGGSVEFAHVGWPRKQPNFKKLWASISEQSGEWQWQPRYPLGQEGPIGAGDEGVDYILWKTFGCGRRFGQLFFLGQCACGADWDDKFQDINSRFFKWFNPLPTKVVKIFAVPHSLPAESIWEASMEAGIIMDRIRLVQAAHSSGRYRKSAWGSVYKRIIRNFS